MTANNDPDESAATKNDKEIIGDIDGVEGMMTDMSLSKKPLKVSLPFRILRHRSPALFSYLRLEVWLLSGTTMNGIVYNVDKTGWYFVLKYLYPEFWMTPDILDEQDEWDHSETNLRESLTEDINSLEERYDHNQVYGIQHCKLPFQCEPRLCDHFGRKAFVKMYEHNDPRFAKAGQRYYTLHVNLTAVEKPTEVNHYVSFAKAKSPVQGVEDADYDPFADNMATLDATACAMNTSSS